MQVSELLVSQLAAWDIRHVFGVTGNAVFPLMDALGRHPDLRFIPFNSETAAAYAASAHAKLTGEPAVLLAGSGPGTTNLLTGIADAHFDRAPVLAITGQVDTSQLHLGTKQYFNHQAALQEFTDFTSLAKDPTQVLPTVQEAMRVAVSRPGVGHVSIPKDVQTATATGSSVPLPAVPEPKAVCAERLDELAGLMKLKSRPMILCGSRARELGPRLAALARAWGAGLALAQSEKGAIPSAEPLLLGGFGEAYLPPLLAEIDCVLEVGRAPYEEGFLPTGATFLRLAEVVTQFFSTGETAHVAGNLPGLLEGLLSRFAGYCPKPDWPARIVAEHHSLQAALTAERMSDEAPIRPQRIVASLSAHLATDAIITLDVGQFMHWFDRGFTTTDQRVVCSNTWRGLGFGVPAALAACLARPRKQVVALVGDGGLLMSLAELATAVRLGLSLTVVVVNNGTYALERDKMLAEALNPYGVDPPTLAFAAFAESTGARGIRVETSSELDSALREALGSRGVTVLDVVTARAPLPYPVAQPADLALKTT